MPSSVIGCSDPATVHNIRGARAVLLKDLASIASAGALPSDTTWAPSEPRVVFYELCRLQDEDGVEHIAHELGAQTALSLR